MTSQPGKEIIVKHILPNISRSKNNQTMKFGQLIEYNMRNIFIEKLFWKCRVETILRQLCKNQNSKSILSISLHLKIYISCFIVCKFEDFRSILKLSCRKLAFLKNKKRFGTNLPVIIFAWILKKNISLVIFC